MKAKVILTVAEAEKDHEKWLEIRNKGIGGSDAGTIMGINPYRSRLSLWMEKTGKQEPKDLADNEAVQWGIRNEPTIATWFAEVTGKKLRKCGTMQSDKYPWLLANVDRLIDGENAGLEIKTAGIKQSKRWEGDEVPDEYYAQCQHYMLVTGCDKWYIAVLLGGNKAIYKEVPRNEQFIEELFEKEAAFWTLVEHDIMPEVDGSKDAKEALNFLYPQAKKETELELETTDKLEEIFKDYADYKKAINDYTILATECENRIKALMGDNERCKIGNHKASWTNSAGRTGIDSEKLKSELPDIYKKYIKVGKPSRRFSMK
jgi:putative phage-type endonuclease